MSKPPIIRPKFRVGDHVDYVCRNVRGGPGPGGSHGDIEAPTKSSLASETFRKAGEEAHGVRKRAVVDAQVSDTEYRLLLRDNQETVWADASEIEPLDAISAIGDLVGAGGRSLRDLLDDDDLIPTCADCDTRLPNDEDQHRLMGTGRARCGPCFTKRCGG